MNTIALVVFYKFNFEFGIKFDPTWVFTLIQNTWYSNVRFHQLELNIA